MSSSDSDASDDDPTAVDEPPLDDNDDCTEDEPEESFETGVLLCPYADFYKYFQIMLLFANTSVSLDKEINGKFI